jgi:hypothetical protein
VALKLRTIKIDDEMWARWQARAKAIGISVTALIIQQMEGPVSALNLPVQTDFPKRETYLRGQGPGKDKKP